MPKTKKRKILKRLLLICLVLVIAGAATVLAVDAHVRNAGGKYIVSDIDQLPEVDAVIILGAYVTPSGDPSIMLRDRLDAGLEVFTLGKTDRIVVTGDHGRTGYDEVNGMRQYLQSKGVNRENIFMDHAGFNTYDSMYRARDVFLIKKAVIVTQEYHLYRALYIARGLGIEAYGYAAEMRPYIDDTYYNIREIAARIKDFFQVNILRPKPQFLGEPLPVWEDGSITDDGKS
jgi:SanA protein